MSGPSVAGAPDRAANRSDALWFTLGRTNQPFVFTWRNFGLREASHSADAGALVPKAGGKLRELGLGFEMVPHGVESTPGEGERRRPAARQFIHLHCSPP